MRCYFAHLQHESRKYWCEYDVDTYYSRQAIIPGNSISDAAARFDRDHGNVWLSCVAAYRGPKEPGEALDKSDEPYMDGYKTNLGKIHYYNGAKPY
jgi:hypothetical protein